LNTDPFVPDFYSVKSDNTKLSINALPDNFDSEVTVPLTFSVKSSGKYHITANEIKNFPIILKSTFLT